MSAIPFNRRGECPALSAPMQTGDGLLVRLNPVSEGLSATQLIGLCESAQRSGNGIVEITARGSFQIRGLTSATANTLAEDVNELGIEVRTGVPIDFSPLAGLDPTEIIDPRPLARALQNAIEANGLSGRLGPKVSVVIDAGGAIDLTPMSADIRLTAARRRNGAFWRISIAGDARNAESMGGASAKGAVDFAMDILQQVALRGVDARARDLLGESDHTIASHEPRSTPTALSPLALSDGRIALPLALPFGTAEAAQFIRFLHAAEQSVISEFRLAPRRCLLALCVDLSTAVSVQAAADRLGFITQPHDPRLSFAACTGAPACASAHIETREIAGQLAGSDVLESFGLVHVSGCAKGCAHPAPAPLTLVGTENGIGLVVNGKAGDAPGAVVRPNDLAEALDTLRRTST